MADSTPIEWTGSTWNPVTGCTLVSEGCRHCYAARLAATRMKHHPSRAGLARLNAAGEAKFTGEVRFNEQWLDQPIRWRKPRRIFVCAHGDLFHENVPDEWIDRVFAVMALVPGHTFQILTKRPERALAYVTALPGRQEGDPNWPQSPLERIAHDLVEDRGFDGGGAATRAFEAVQDWPLPNVWLGTSVEDQATADARIPHLLATPAAVRFVSAEPLLGEVDLSRVPHTRINKNIVIATNALTGINGLNEMGPRLDWVIVGGESGPKARVWPGFEDAARSLRDQCLSAGVAFFMKQMAGQRKATMPPIPDDLMVREFPHG